jgi:hypothetical protein
MLPTNYQFARLIPYFERIVSMCPQHLNWVLNEMEIWHNNKIILIGCIHFFNTQFRR